MRIRHSIVAVSLLPSVAGAAITPVHLAPSSPWVVDYAENSCRLVRRFGEGKDLTTFALESEAPGSLDMVVIGKPLASGSGQADAKFLPLQPKLTSGILTETADGRIPSVLIDDVHLLPEEAVAAEEARQAERRAHPHVRPAATSLAEQASRKAQRQAFANATTAIEIVTRHDRPVILDSGSLGEAIEAFEQCSRDSLRDWGVDPDVDEKIVRPVWAADPAAWFSSDDYPRDMLALSRESVVKVRVLVDATGHVTKCTSLSHFNAPEFNKITCEKFSARARFEPAELADGTKVPSYYVNKVHFRIGF